MAEQSVKNGYRLIKQAESSNQKLAINCEIEITLAPAQAAGSARLQT